MDVRAVGERSAVGFLFGTRTGLGFRAVGRPVGNMSFVWSTLNDAPLGLYGNARFLAPRLQATAAPPRELGGLKEACITVAMVCIHTPKAEAKRGILDRIEAARQLENIRKEM